MRTSSIQLPPATKAEESLDVSIGFVHPADTPEGATMYKSADSSKGCKQQKKNRNVCVRIVVATHDRENHVGHKCKSRMQQHWKHDFVQENRELEQ